MIMGLDISTSCVGIAVMDEAGKVVELTHVQPEAVDSIIARATEVRHKLADLFGKYSIDLVVVEEAAQAFQGGKTTAYTIARLSQMNILIRDFCYQIMDVEPVTVMATTARKQVMGTQKRGEDQKANAFAYVRERYPQWDIQRTPRSHEIQKYHYDEADAAIMAYYGVKIFRIPS